MRSITHDLWNDEAGFIISAELALVSTLCVLGLVVGLTAVRDSVNCELTDLSAAICSLDQSYYYGGFSSRKWPGCCTTKAWTSGSAFYQGCKTCGINNYNNVDFVTTTNVAPCTTCTTVPAVVPAPAPVVVPAPAPAVIEQPRIIEQPKPAVVPCPAPAPAAVPCPPASSSTSVINLQPVSTICPTPAAGSCPAPAVIGCPTSAPVVAPACDGVRPMIRPVLVPQDQTFNW